MPPAEDAVRRKKDTALLMGNDVVDHIKYTAIEHNIRIMSIFNNESSFGSLIEAARSEKQWKSQRAYLDILSEYFTYMTKPEKQITLNFLYELLSHREGDIRRQAGRLMGKIIAKYDDVYRKELPECAQDSSINMTEADEIWDTYLHKIVFPDYRVTDQHRSWIGYTLKGVLTGILENADSDKDDDSLRKGATGSAVKDLQTKLKKLGFYNAYVDGSYGDTTVAAVKAFQKKMNITPVDGIAGDKTLTLLYSSDAVDSDEYATLRPGDTGAAVRTMQATLYELGYYDGSRDGVYGATTQDAVRAFQIRNKVTPVDGIAGNKTLTKLYSGTAVAAAAKTTEYKTLRKGDRGDEVVQMQDSLQQLGYLAAVTGYYDDATVAAVRSFQSRNGLSVDGSAGQETLAVLYGSNPRAAY